MIVLVVSSSGGLLTVPPVLVAGIGFPRPPLPAAVSSVVPSPCPPAPRAAVSLSPLFEPSHLARAGCGGFQPSVGKGQTLRADLLVIDSATSCVYKRLHFVFAEGVLQPLLLENTRLFRA